MNKKFFTFLFVVFILCICNFSFALTTINEVSESQVLNSGTKLTNYNRFTDKGWLNINVIEVNLKDKNTSLEILTSANGLQTFQTVKTMAENAKNCIAAINADFFTGNSKKGCAMGLSIKDGQVLSSTYYENEVQDTFATFVANKDSAFLDYFSNDMMLTNKSNKKTLKISEYNKWSSDYSYPVMYTKEWGEKSLGSNPELLLTELVVKNNKVVEVRYNEEPVEIPANGFVICAVGDAGTFIQENFKKGNRVSFENDLKLDVEKVNVAISGGTILVKDGEVCEFTHNITGSHPRTAVGISKDGKTIYLITVDGRQVASIGMTQTELAEFIVEKGIYTAMNLDGGGSTTMIARELGDTNYTIENLPSEGTLRYVPNALAILNTTRTGTLNNLVIEINNTNLFSGDKVELKIKGYDKYFNPVEVKESKLKWSYDGAPVSFEGNTLIAGNEPGISKITGSVGKIKTSIDINILEKEEKDYSGEIENGIKILIAPETKNNILFDRFTNKKLENIINNSNGIVIMPEQSDSELLANIKSKYIHAKGHTINNYDSSTIITLDISKGGIRATDSNQWISLKNNIASAKDNLIIVLNGNLNDFTDSMEKELFIDTLKNSNKNIWIIQKGNVTGFEEINNIKCLNINSNDGIEPSMELIHNSNYIEISIDENEMKYKIRNIFEN